MKDTDVVSMAKNLMDKYSLVDWEFKIDNAKRRLGCCKTKWTTDDFLDMRLYYYKCISFSKYYLHLQENQIKDTLLHEIAHALVGNHNKHNHIWKHVAQSQATPKVVLYCPHCDNKSVFYRKPRCMRSCGKCYPQGFNKYFLMVPKYELTFGE